MDGRKSKNKKSTNKQASFNSTKVDPSILLQSSELLHDDGDASYLMQNKHKQIQELVNNWINKPQNFFPKLDQQNGKIRSNIDNTKNFNMQLISNFPNATKILSSYTEFDKGNTNGFRNSKSNLNPIIIEQTTTHTTTTRTVKVKGNEDINFNLLGSRGLSDQAQMLQQFFESGFPHDNFQNNVFGNRLLEDLGDPQIGELLYSDQPQNQKEIERKSKWINEAYGSLTEKSQYKTQLLKLVEYNKIEICENDGFLEQKTEIEIVICKLMRQRLTNDELKHEIESYQFQGLLNEQQSLIYSMIKLTKKSIHTLYKKCQNIIWMKSVLNDRDKRKSSQVFLKDLMVNSKDYIDIARKIGDLYDDMIKKAQVFRTTTAKIFDSQSGFKYIQNESIVKGFFFLFIYRDFILREILTLMNEMLSSKVQQTLAQVEKDYEKFIESELVEWVNLMLACGAFQSYSSIVTPYEAQEFKKKPDGTKYLSKINEGSNYFLLQKRYMKLFLRVYNQITTKRSVQMVELIDSDFDEDDEIQQSEMDEIFSISQHSEDFEKDQSEFDSDMDEHESQFHNFGMGNSKDQFPFNYNLMKNDYNQFNSRISSNNDQYLQLYSQYQKLGCEDCKKQLIQQNHLCQKHSKINLTSSSSNKALNQGANFDEDSNQPNLQEQTQDNGDTQGKKKKKRRKNKKKKKKNSGEGESSNTVGTQEKTNGGEEEVPAGACSQYDDQNLSDDPEFEENLKQFQIRLQEQNNQISSQRNGQQQKLKPNVSNDWLLTMKEKCKSYNNSISRVEQPTLVS